MHFGVCVCCFLGGIIVFVHAFVFIFVIKLIILAFCFVILFFFLFLHFSVLCQEGIKHNCDSPLFMLWDFVLVLHEYAYVHVCIMMCVVVVVNNDNGDVVMF